MTERKYPMKTYDVCISEIKNIHITVNAENDDDAEAIAREKYDNYDTPYSEDEPETMFSVVETDPITPRLCQYSYLTDLTFYAGDNDKENTDRGIYILKSSEFYTDFQMTKLIADINKKLNDYEKDDDGPSYEDGINIDTLIDGIEYYTKIKVIPAECFQGFIDCCYKLTIWQ